MILIFTNNSDYTTNEVVKWLYYFKKKFIRINENEFFEIDIVDNKIFLYNNKTSFYLDDIKSVWFRRGGIRLLIKENSNYKLNEILFDTQKSIEDYIIYKLEQKKCINKQSNKQSNKLIILEIAKQQGLLVPEYYLACNTDNVVLHKTISKTISENIVIPNWYEDANGIIFTNIIKKKIECNFYPSFFQEYIDKKYEIRTFFLNNRFWSSAIFSQSNKKTIIDQRNYDINRPNRINPYILPKNVEKKLTRLMNILDYNCGSIDMIVGKDDNIYFLEVNPIGQFLGIASECNYPITKEIAEYL